MVKIFKNFKEKKTFKPEAGAEGKIMDLNVQASSDLIEAISK
jgi:hypothetical protein